MIRFSCPSCRTVLTTPDQSAGEKLACTTCGQRLQVPLPPRNKTVLGEPLPPVVQEVLPAGAADRPSRRPRRDDLDEEEGDRPRRRVVCPYCRSREPPDVRSEMGQTGLILMIVLLFVFFPLFWIGFLIRDEVPYCSECGAKLGRSLF